MNFEGLTPQMVEALAMDDVKTLEDFATCADWELAGGWTTENGERKKDDGILEKFEVSLEEAQDRWAQPVVTRRKLGVCAVCCEQELGQIVGSDRHEGNLRQQLVEHLDQRGHFDHRAVLDRLGQHDPLVRAQEILLLFEHRARGIEFPRFRHHGEHDR